VKVWKVILATLVIFAAGMFAGGVVVKRSIPKLAKPEAPVPPILFQQRFKEKLKKELTLEAEQAQRIDRIFAESGERMKILWGLIGPEVEAEKREVRDKIRAELNAEQREKFEQLLKRPSHQSDPKRSSRPGTNESGAVTNSAK
jgi:hypothetical protein